MPETTDLNSDVPRGNVRFDALKNVRYIEWSLGLYRVSVHLAKPLEQLANTYHATKKKYAPCGEPKSWFIERNKWSTLANGGYPRFSAHLFLDETDFPQDTISYVPSGKKEKNS